MVISVVIPLYNKALTIDAAIASVVAQSWADWRLIVVDDGSRDSGPELVSQWEAKDPRIKLVSQANAGVSAARNHGAAMSSSEYVAFLDADDVWLPDHLENLAALSQAVPEAVMWAAAYRLVDDVGNDRPVHLQPEVAGGLGYYLIDDYFTESVRHEFPVHSSAVMVRKSALQAIGGFPVGVRSGEDVLTWARLSCMGPFPISRSATALYMAPPIAPARRREVVRRPVSPCPVLQGLDELAERYPNRLASIEQFRGLWWRIRSMSFMELNERRSALHDVWQAVKASGLRRRDVLTIVLLCLPHGLQSTLIARSRGYRLSVPKAGP